jgi:Arc/MetJ-type ribon-helix-helix transcriptional regulator
MDDRPGKVDKTLVSVTLTRPYLDALDRLIEEGVYLSRGEAVLEGLRIILRRHGLDPFRPHEWPPEEEGAEAGRRG